MSEPEVIVERALAVAAGRDDLRGIRAVVTAGGTREPIDPVRFIGNRSSGRQGVALALAAAERGADVTLIVAHVDDGVLDEVAAHPRISISRVSTPPSSPRPRGARHPDADVVVMAAAVADYRVAEVAALKRSKEDAGGPHVSLELDRDRRHPRRARRCARGEARRSSASRPRRRRMPTSCASADVASAAARASTCSR